MRASPTKRFPPEPVRVHVESLSHDGRGLARHEGKTVFIDGALPGEEVRFVYRARRRSFDEAAVCEVLQAAGERVTPRCPHFGVCGGCSLQHLRPDAQVQAKQKVLLEHLKDIGGVAPQTVLPPLTGPVWGYRRRARLGVRYVRKKERVLVGFREKRGRFVADLASCDVLDSSVGQRIETLKALVGSMDAYQRIAQIEVAVGDNATALVFRNLVDLGPADRDRLIAFAREHDVQVYLQPGGPESASALWPTDAYLCYGLPDHDLNLGFAPTDFVQVNAELNRQMVNRVIQLLELNADDRVLELFCGLGNFSLPLARRAAAVLGLEGDAGLVHRARDNAARNDIHNVEFRACDLARELPHGVRRISGYNKAIIDPPRTGAQALVPELQRFAPERMVYVSCNTSTLARDAGALVGAGGYRLEAAGVMDMFPHTAHVEAVALFVRAQN